MYIKYIVYNNLITHCLCCWCWVHTSLFTIGHYACQFTAHCILIGCCLYPIVSSNVSYKRDGLLLERMILIDALFREW